MDPLITQPPRPALTWWKIGRAVIMLVGALALVVGGVVALARGDGIAGPLLTFGIILLVFGLINVALLARLRRLDAENRFGIPLE